MTVHASIEWKDKLLDRYAAAEDVTADGDLVFLAGPRAMAMIRDRGLHPDMVSVVAGAAGGPKWLVLSHLDRYLFGHWFARRRRPLFLLGASIGAWRFSAVSRRDPVSAIDAFEEAYVHQRYHGRPSPAEVTAVSRRIMDQYLGKRGAGEVLDHPYCRISILAARCRGWTASGHRAKLGLGLAAAVLYNACSRRLLGRFFQRGLFFDPRNAPPFFHRSAFPIHRVPLNVDNYRDALLASGSIPLVMDGVHDIQGAPAGTYRDGGVLDYHLDVPYDGIDDGIVLFPHYTHRVIPGWLDKRLPWRQPSAAHMDRVLLAAPSPSFVRRLPLAKIPDRKDFYRFASDDAGRIAYWQTVIDSSRQLADALDRALASGDLGRHLMPLPAL